MERQRIIQPAVRQDGAGDKNGFKGRQPLLSGSVAVAEMNDLPAIMKLICKGASEGNLVQRSEEDVAADIRLGGAFVYRQQAGIGGTLFLSVYSHDLVELRSFYVNDKGKGIGTALMKAALETAQKLGITEILAITRQENEHMFTRFGFDKRSGFQTALFRKNNASHERYDGQGVQDATLSDMAELVRFMDVGEASDKLIPRSSAEILADMRAGNAFVYRERSGGAISGMVFLTRYSNRLGEIRSLYANAQNAEAALVRRVVARGDELGVNELMAVVKNGNGQAFTGHGFAEELNGFRTALFKELHGANDGVERSHTVYLK